MKISFALLFFAALTPAAAQTPQVPHKMSFADLTLIIRDDARSEIQKDVDALTRSPKHFNIKVERAKTYFPIIEKIFRDENVPDDLKYLVLQESALIADAVSVSDAVGFWQFKDFTAAEMGMRVDKDIDERMNIVSSSRAAARYLKKNHSMFDNWIFALQAYQMGAGGVMRSVKDTQPGVKRMEITAKTYWYVKKFLAHKVAFEGSVTGKPEIEIVTVENRSGRSLKSLADEMEVDFDALLAYNKWTKSGRVPADRVYTVVIPNATRAVVAQIEQTAPVTPDVPTTSSVPRPQVVRINGVPAVAALANESAQEFASRMGIKVSHFLKWNDLRHTSPAGKLKAGDPYFIARKRVRATENFHKLSPDESLWAVSQRYGVKLKRLKRFNRLREDQKLEPGTMLYLASRRPRVAPDAAPIENALAMDDETLAWEIAPEKTGDATITVQVSDTVVVVEDETAPTVPTDEVVAADSEEVLSTPASDPEPVVVVPVQRAGDTVQPEETKVVPDEHVVEAGQTLYAIARTYGVSVMDLVTWNNLDLQAGLRIGQVLKVSGTRVAEPSGVAAAAEQNEFIHEVKASDTLYGIARQYGVTIKELMDWNGKTDFALAVGERLKIQRHR